MLMIDPHNTDRANAERGSFARDVPALELLQLSKSFADDQIKAVQQVSMTVSAGEIVSILGPSGCGKTTTMRMIAGLDEPTGGDIRIAGKSVVNVPTHNRNIGLVFQSLAVFPHMSVRQNVAFGLRMKKTPKDEIQGRVERALDLVQLPAASFGNRRPAQLSGGQLQRVAVARTIVTEPALVLFDEPMAALDRRLRDHMAVELRAIQKDLNIAAVYVTHDQETASMMSDRIAIMDAGKLVQIGTPVDIYQQPANRFIAEFLGDLNTLTATVSRQGGSSVAGAIAIAGGELTVSNVTGNIGASVRVLVRPEHIRLQNVDTSSAGTVQAQVTDMHFVSGTFRWQLRLSDGQELMVRTSTRLAGLGIGDHVGLDVDPTSILIAKE